MNYSAFTKVKEKVLYFVGEDTIKKNGKTYYCPFKIVCPKCQAEGNNLEHINWYESKETGRPLIILCKKCDHKINADDDKELDKCKVYLTLSQILW